MFRGIDEKHDKFLNEFLIFLKTGFSAEVPTIPRHNNINIINSVSSVKSDKTEGGQNMQHFIRLYMYIIPAISGLA